MTPKILVTVFGLVSLILVLKALFLGAATAAARGKLKQFINAEDSTWLKGQHVASDGEAVARIGRAHRNDLENLVLFAMSGALYIVAGGSPVAGITYCAVFLSGRLLHSFAYLTHRPSLRRSAYTIGFLAIAAMSVHAAAVLLTRI